MKSLASPTQAVAGPSNLQQDKGKGRIVVEVVIDGEAEDERGEEEVKEDIVEVKRPVAPLPAVMDTEGRRRNPVLTGQLQDPPCQRCVRGGEGVPRSRQAKPCQAEAGEPAYIVQKSRCVVTMTRVAWHHPWCRTRPLGALSP